MPTGPEVNHFVGREIPDIVNEVLTAASSLPPRPGHVGSDDDWRAMVRTTDWWLERMRTSRWIDRSPSIPHPLIEKMTLFWHGHFATAFDKVGDDELMWQQNQIIRDEALADFETLCQRVSRNGAMLIYLDNESNRAGAEQENFARELMELFTMGVGNYTETDVVEMARAWTGHGTVGWIESQQRYDGTYEWHPEEHDFGGKSIFGIRRNWDGPETITEIVRGSKQNATARFVATKLWRFFAHGAPSPAVVNTLAATFINNDCSILELMRAILIHPEFWAPSTRGALVKSPTQFVVDFNRRTAIPFDDENMRWFMEPMGQILFDPPNVAGWGTNGYWLSTATMWGRAQYATNKRWKLNRAGFFDELEGMNAVDGTNHLLGTFGVHERSTNTVNAIRQWFTTTKNSDPWALAPIGVSVAALCPEFQVI